MSDNIVNKSVDYDNDYNNVNGTDDDDDDITLILTRIIIII